MRIRINYYYFITILILCISMSCRVQREIADYNICNTREKKVLKDAYENNLDYTTIKIQRIDVSYSDEKNKMNLNGWMRIVKDSCVLVSLNPGLGIEFARIYIYPDSAFYFDRMKKDVWIISKSLFKKRYFDNYDIKTIQDIIIGNIPYIYSSNEFNTENDCDKEAKLFIHKRNFNDYEIKNIIDNNYKNARLVLDEKRNNIFFTCDYKYDKDGIIKELEIIGNLRGNVLKLDIEYGKIILNEEIETKMNIPEKYNKKIIE